MRLGRASLVSFAAMGFIAFSAPDEAEACGGTFCDSGPSSMPVDQSGENILFVMDGQNVEAHVQIEYQGSASRFAWVVPMPKIPDVSVGSEALFQNLLQGTVPSYGLQVQPDQCGNQGFGGASAGGSGGGGGFGTGGAAGSGGGPTVVYDKTVGAFQVVVLQGGTAQEVSDWLVTNNYQTIASAPSILQDYVQKGYVFAAIKLTAGANASEIHPLVFKYQGTTPCVPLELTAVAATEDMGVRAFFLGDDRVVPTNYKSVVLNPVRVDWSNLGFNYNQAISRAVDTPVADGHAFVTEYAGPSSIVSSSGVFSPSWDASPFVTIDPTTVIDELTNQGLAYCTPGYCQFYHPLLLPLLHTYLPLPAGMTDDQFYGCLSCNAGSIDLAKWDGAAFSADFQTRIIDPGAHAQSVLAKYPYLTRLFTTISPTEMSLDPDFVADPSVSYDTVDDRTQTATERITCNARYGVTLPDGRDVGLDGFSWPAFGSDMPWAERIEDFAAGGDPVVLVDNTAAIDAALAKWNKSIGWPPVGAGGSGGNGGVVGVGANGGQSGSGGNPATAGTTPSGGGCACSAVGANEVGSRLGIVALGLALAAFGRRRKPFRS
jgi:MYXO-CTERM domain-containing protein